MVTRAVTLPDTCWNTGLLLDLVLDTVSGFGAGFGLVLGLVDIGLILGSVDLGSVLESVLGSWPVWDWTANQVWFWCEALILE